MPMTHYFVPCYNNQTGRLPLTSNLIQIRLLILSFPFIILMNRVNIDGAVNAHKLRYALIQALKLVALAPSFKNKGLFRSL